MLRRHSAKLHHLRPGYHLQFYSKKVMSSFQWFAFSITFVLGTFTNIGDSRAVVVVKWSACSPTTLSIRIRIPLKFNSVNCLKKNGNKQKEVGDGPFFVKNIGDSKLPSPFELLFYRCTRALKFWRKGDFTPNIFVRSSLFSKIKVNLKMFYDIVKLQQQFWKVSFFNFRRSSLDFF